MNTFLARLIRPETASVLNNVEIIAFDDEEFLEKIIALFPGWIPYFWAILPQGK